MAHNNLGRILYHEGEVTQATEHFYAALRHNPDSVHPNINMGDIFFQNGQTEGTLEFYAKGLNSRQGVEYAHCALARAYSVLGQKAKAIDHYTKALVLKPDLVVANINLASILATDPDQKVRDADRAIPLAERACRLSQ